MILLPDGTIIWKGKVFTEKFNREDHGIPDPCECESIEDYVDEVLIAMLGVGNTEQNC